MNIVAGNNVLNVQMAPAPPGQLTFSSPLMTVKGNPTDLSGMSVIINRFSCVVSNQTAQPITRTVQFVYQKADKFGVWGAPIRLPAPAGAAPGPITSTLQPGQQYTYAFDGSWIDYSSDPPAWRIWFSWIAELGERILVWLEDNLGNKSPQISDQT